MTTSASERTAIAAALYRVRKTTDPDAPLDDAALAGALYDDLIAAGWWLMQAPGPGQMAFIGSQTGDPELNVIDAFTRALAGLDPDQRRRCCRYIFDRYAADTEAP